MIIRKASIYDSIGITKVYIETLKSSHKTFIDSNYVESVSFDKQKRLFMNKLNKESLIYVAESKIGEIVAFAIPEVSKDANGNNRGEIAMIYVLDRFQGEGIGFKLIQKSVKTFIKSNINSMVMWVLKDNPSNGFCESLGGEPKETKLLQLGTLDYVSIGYVWKDLESCDIFK